MTAPVVGFQVRRNVVEIRRLAARLEDTFELSPELTPVDATSSDDMERALRFLRRLNDLVGRRPQ